MRELTTCYLPPAIRSRRPALWRQQAKWSLSWLLAMLDAPAFVWRERLAILLSMIALAISLGMLVGCAVPAPVVDPQSIGSPTVYSRDLYDCRGLTQARGSTGYNAAATGIGGAIVGSIVGVVVGALVGHPGAGAAIGAGSLGTYGLVAGAGHSMADQSTIFAACMEGRGYRVLLP